MDINEILFSINQVSDLSEKYFLDLGNLFASLLDRDSENSIQHLQSVLKTMQAGNEKTTTQEDALFNGYDEKYNPLFFGT